MKLDLASLVRHSTGVVGAVEKVYAAGEHPSATCEVVRLSTGDELVLKPGEFEIVPAHEALVFLTLVAAFRGIVGSTAEMGGKTGIPFPVVAGLLRGAPARPEGELGRDRTSMFGLPSPA